MFLTKGGKKEPPFSNVSLVYLLLKRSAVRWQERATLPLLGRSTLYGCSRVMVRVMGRGWMGVGLDKHRGCLTTRLLRQRHV